MLYDKNKIHFSLQPVTQFGEGNPNLFTIDPHNPQQVLIKNTTLIFLGSGNKYNLNDPDLQCFISNAQLDNLPQNMNLIYSFLNDLKYNINYEDKKSERYYFIKDLVYQYIHQQIPYQLSQLGSGLNFVFLPSDPDELVDQLKLLYFEKVGGNDNPQLNEQIIANVDKLLEYECITTNQYQNIISTFTEGTEGAVRASRDSKKDQFVE